MSERRERVSRRDFLNIAAVGGGALLAAGFASAAPAAAKKLSEGLQ